MQTFSHAKLALLVCKLLRGSTLSATSRAKDQVGMPPTGYVWRAMASNSSALHAAARAALACLARSQKAHGSWRQSEKGSWQELRKAFWCSIGAGGRRDDGPIGQCWIWLGLRRVLLHLSLRSSSAGRQNEERLPLRQVATTSFAFSIR